MLALKPQSITVSNASVEILPEVSPDPAEFVTWSAGLAVTYGQRMQNDDGVIYWCVSAGTTGATAPDHLDGDEADGTVTWRVVNRRRRQLVICNDSTAVIYLAFKDAAEANHGIRLNAGGGVFNAMTDLAYCPQGPVYAIAAVAGSNNLSIQEF